MVVRTNVMLEPDLWKFAIEYGSLDDRSGSYIVNKLIKDLKSKQEKKTKPVRVVNKESALMWIPLNTGEHPIIQSDIDQWCLIYPAVDVLSEMRAMVGWSKSNASKRKTSAGIEKFINSWLKKAQDKGGSGFNSAPKNNNEHLGGQW